jgi:hypothetical protein
VPNTVCHVKCQGPVIYLAGVSFECGDLLASDLSSVGVLLLTEQCWDDELIAKVSGCCAAGLCG